MGSTTQHVAFSSTRLYRRTEKQPNENDQKMVFVMTAEEHAAWNHNNNDTKKGPLRTSPRPHLRMNPNFNSNSNNNSNNNNMSLSYTLGAGMHSRTRRGETIPGMALLSVEILTEDDGRGSSGPILAM